MDVICFVFSKGSVEEIFGYEFGVEVEILCEYVDVEE